MVSYAYDVAGIRDSKTVTTSEGSITYNYLTQNGQVVRQTWTDTSGSDHVMDFIYDNNGAPYAFIYDGTTFYYMLNLQGDVIRIVNSAGVTAASYAYDAWGNPVGVAGAYAEINPIRYRGYYYDSETGLYYVSSRYYDPAVKRFINADDVGVLGIDQGSLLQYNLFAYCLNNPANRTDETGNISLPNWAKVTIGAVATVAAVGITVATCGAGSVAGVAMITATATLAAKATEVAVLQVKKGKSEGKSGSQIAKDTVESIYDNGSKIVGLTPVTKSAGIAFNHGLSAIVEKGFGGTQTLSATLKSTGGKVMPYAFVAIAWSHTIISAFSDDPVTRANARGYVLK